MKIEIRVAWVLRYIGSSTTRTSTILPSAGAITYRSPRGPVRDGSRKKATNHTASNSSGTSSTHMARPHTATPHAPTATSPHPKRIKGHPSGAILITTPHRVRSAECGMRNGNGRSVAERPRHGYPAFRTPHSAFVPSSNIQSATRNPLVRLCVPLARRLHHLPRQRRRRGVPVPLAVLLQAREVVPQRLLVEARLAPAGRIPVGRPEPRRVGREKLVDHEQAAGRRRAELELGIGDGDPARRCVGAAGLVQAQARALELLGERPAQR